MQLSFCGPSKYKSRMLEMLRKETQIQIELPTSHCHILKAHVIESCYDLFFFAKSISKSLSHGTREVPMPMEQDSLIPQLLLAFHLFLELKNIFVMIQIFDTHVCHMSPTSLDSKWITINPSDTWTSMIGPGQIL